MKTCFKCSVAKPLSEFYKHSMMADGHLNKCKECTKRDVREWNAATREARSQYERRRSQSPERKASRAAYLKSRDPIRRRASWLTWNAIRSGKLVRQPCEVCAATEGIQAHHDDYTKPLDVRWLCFGCHRAHHGQEVTVRVPKMHRHKVK